MFLDRSHGSAARHLTSAAAALVVGSALATLLHPGMLWLQLLPWLLAALLVPTAVLLSADQRRSAHLQREFATELSHQVRTPLAHIRLYNEMLLLGRDRSEEERSQWLEIVGREAVRLGEVVENLLLVAYDPAARQYPARRPTDLGALLEDVAAAYAVDAASRGSTIISDPVQGVIATVDARAVQQAVANLLDNALRYGPQGQTITLSLEPDLDVAVICVANEGSGISQRDRYRIWKPFERVASADQSEPGSGLGLTAVQQIACAHGGRAYMEDGPEGATRFCIALPKQ
jgi:signal transduction histidine kinase